MIVNEEKIKGKLFRTISLPVFYSTKILIEKDTALIKYYFYESALCQTNRKVAVGSMKPISKIFNLKKFDE